MYSRGICTVPLDVQDDKTLPHNLAPLLIQAHAITRHRSHCVLAGEPFTVPCAAHTPAGEAAREGQNSSAEKVTKQRETMSRGEGGEHWAAARLTLTQTVPWYGRPTALHTVLVADLFHSVNFIITNALKLIISNILKNGLALAIYSTLHQESSIKHR